MLECAHWELSAAAQEEEEALLATLAVEAWKELEHATVRDADGSLRAKNEKPMSEEAVQVQWEFFLMGV